MALNFSTMVYLPCYDLFARPVTVFPLASKPGTPPFTARGIYDSRTLAVALDDGSILSDQDTILDIRDVEFVTVPAQDDEIDIDVDPNADLPRVGRFVVADASNNGGGETTLQLKKIGP